MTSLPHPANNDEPEKFSWGRNQKILEWLTRLAQPGLSFDMLGQSFDRQEKTSVEQSSGSPLFDDWQTVSNLCGHAINDFIKCWRQPAPHRR